jgi:hypothetical protein
LSLMEASEEILLPMQLLVEVSVPVYFRRWGDGLGDACSHDACSIHPIYYYCMYYIINMYVGSLSNSIPAAASRWQRFQESDWFGPFASPFASHGLCGNKPWRQQKV